MNKLDERVSVKMDIPNDVIEFHKLFKKEKFKLYVVGGAIRDFLLGTVPHDYDLVTDAQPTDVVKILKDFRTDIHGVHFGVVRVYTKDNPLGYEIASYRRDIAKGRNNKGNDQKVEVGKHITINDDVRRRDLTINSLYYDIDTNEIVDAVGGISDLNNKIIRAVGVPQKRFNEDRLRILRTLRTASITNGKIDKLTSEAILKDNRLFGISEEDDVSRERIFAEFIKVKDKSKENNDPGIITRFIDLLIDYNILSQIFPVLVTTKSISPTSYLTVALAQTLRNNRPTIEFKKTLVDAKIPNDYVEIISFLIKILRDGVTQDTVYEIYREMSSKNIRKDIIAEWIRVMGISDDMVIGLLKYQPTTTGHEVMKDGFKGGQIGEEIKRREGIKYINMIKGVNEKNNILKFNQFKNK